MVALVDLSLEHLFCDSGGYGGDLSLYILLGALALKLRVKLCRPYDMLGSFVSLFDDSLRAVLCDIRGIRYDAVSP